MPKILFISHEASLTGAPILLLRLIGLVKKNASFEILILLIDGGALEKDFEEHGKTFVWNRVVEETKNSKHKWKNRIYRRLGIPTPSRQQQSQAAILNEVSQADIVFNNTIANISLLKELPIQGKKIFSYIHEMEIVTELLATKEDITYLGTVSDKIFVPAQAVKDFLFKTYQVQENKIVVLKSIIPQHDNKWVNIQSGGFNSNRIGGNRFLVGFCGTPDLRKGFDLLPLLARKIVLDKSITDIHFVWIGVNKSAFNYIVLCQDIIKLKLDTYFTFIENEPDIQRYLAQLDVFVLPSREDPFPLVVLEAATYKVPCIYFLNAGGISEFCGNDAGMPIDYLDCENMAEAIVRLKSDEVYRKALGERAKEKVSAYSESSFNINQLIEYFKISFN